MVEVSAASDTKTKNIEDHNHPKGICEKRLGRVINISSGPCAGLMPNVNTVGKIKIPESMDTSVSKQPTVSAVRPRPVLLE